MYEVEIKVRASHDDVLELLGDLGGRKQDTFTQVDTYFSVPHRDFAETDEALRIRRVDGDSFITYKGAKIDESTKTREEINISIEEDEELEELLTRLGFEPVLEIKKQRTIYTVDGIEVMLDEVEGLGEYVEFELESKEEDLDKARNRLYNLLDKLGFDESESITDSYMELLLEK